MPTVVEVARKVVGDKPLRWASPGSAIGDFEGRERVLEVFHVAAAEQRPLARAFWAVREELRDAGGGPVVTVFHTPRESRRVHWEYLAARGLMASISVIGRHGDDASSIAELVLHGWPEAILSPSRNMGWVAPRVTSSWVFADRLAADDPLDHLDGLVLVELGVDRATCRFASEEAPAASIAVHLLRRLVARRFAQLLDPGKAA